VGPTHNTQISFTAALSRERKKERERGREREYICIYIYEVSAFFDIGLCKNQVNVFIKEQR
jgi:hypothetical protein